MAASGDDCLASDGCKLHGRCGLQDGECAATVASFCGTSQWCGLHGDCALIDGVCAPGSDADCAQSTLKCNEEGKCAFLDGHCRPGSQEHCADSQNCSVWGHCKMSKNGLDCIAMEDEDCFQADVCKYYRKCIAKWSQCVANAN